MSVNLSTKSFFDFNKIWNIGWGQWVMHDGMQYDLNQGQGHDTRALEIWKSFHFQKLSLLPFTMEAGN